MLPAPALPGTARKLAATAPAAHGRAAGTAPPAGASSTAAASEASGCRLTASKRNRRRASGGVGEAGRVLARWEQPGSTLFDADEPLRRPGRAAGESAGGRADRARPRRPPRKRDRRLPPVLYWRRVLEQGIYLGDNLDLLRRLPDESFTLVYADPPFNTGRDQRRLTLSTSRDEAGDRTGFGGHRYRTETTASRSYPDRFDDYAAFIEPRLREARRLLAADGTLYLHLDYREAHYCKVLLDELFGRDVLPERDHLGLRLRRPRQAPLAREARHDPRLRQGPGARTTSTREAVDREPYMAPGLVDAEKAARGKLPTDVWWHTIVSPTGREKTGYPTQKPLGVLRRIVQASSREGDWCLDFFAGSGTLGAAALELGRGVRCSATTIPRRSR